MTPLPSVVSEAAQREQGKAIEQVSRALQTRRDLIVEALGPRIFSMVSEVESEGIPRSQLAAIVVDMEPELGALSSVDLGVEPIADIPKRIRFSRLDEAIAEAKRIAAPSTMPCLYCWPWGIEVFSLDRHAITSRGGVS